MAQWYKVDTHFGDARIRAFFDRPFATVAAMDAAILARLVERVGRQDNLWIVGDFAIPDLAERNFEAVPGRKHLVHGNHDLDGCSALTGPACMIWWNCRTARSGSCCATIP